MSARQRGRLREVLGLEDQYINRQQISEEDSSESVDNHIKPNFQALAFHHSSSDSENEENSDENEIRPKIEEKRIQNNISNSQLNNLNKKDQQNVSKKGETKSLDRKKFNVADDDGYLDQLIAELKSKEIDREISDTLNPVSKSFFLCSSTAYLDSDAEMKRRFGSRAASIAENYEAENRNAGNQKKNKARANRYAAKNIISRRQLIFGAPKDEWTRPPTFVGGGLGMEYIETSPNSETLNPLKTLEKNAQWFTYKWPNEYTKLEEKFEKVQATADPNNLVLMSIQHPHHANTLLQVGTVFAHTGQMDHASDFIRRCLHVLEFGMTESFKSSLLLGNARLDITCEENAALFNCLFSYAKMCSMKGCRRTALEISKLLLSLDPYGDPTGIMLLIDSHALASKENQFICDLAESDLLITHWSDISSCSTIEENSSDQSPTPTPTNGIVTVKDIPGLGLSVALALFNMGRISEARDQGKRTLRRFPSLLETLLEKCGIADPKKYSGALSWKDIFVSNHFLQAKRRAKNNSLLNHLTKIYAERTGEIWKSDDYMGFLFDCAGLALQGVNDNELPFPEEEEVLKRAYYLDESPLRKYLDFQLSYFADTYQSLPADANILDPRLIGPHMVNRRGIGEALNNQLMQHENVRHLLQGGEGNFGWEGLNQGFAAREGNLDPNSPIVELLWRTLLPWNSMATPQNPPPEGGNGGF